MPPSNPLKPDDLAEYPPDHLPFVVDSNAESGNLLPALAKLLIDLAEQEEAKQRGIQGNRSANTPLTAG
jgi:hypothetical protein